MPKLLYLLRHAQSAEKQSGQPDKERELTTSGVKESLLIGNFLNKQNFFPDIIITSTANRAHSTARLVADALKLDLEKLVSDEELYTASVRTFFEFISRLDDSYNSALCVGHNPVISYLAEYLTKAEIGDMASGGLVTVKLAFSNWKDLGEGNGELVSYVYPEMLENN